MTENIGFLLSDVSRLMRRRFDERARLIGVTRPQWRALVALRLNEGINQGRLADLLEVEPITLCRMVDRLEEAGHVERRRDPQDRRAWRIYLTEKSRPLLDQLQAIADDLFTTALHEVNGARQQAFVETLIQIQTNLSQASDGNEAING